MLRPQPGVGSPFGQVWVLSLTRSSLSTFKSRNPASNLHPVANGAGRGGLESGRHMKPRDFCPKWTFPLHFRAHLYIFTKATVCPNAYISVCLTWKTVFAACLEALFMFFLSLGALLLSQCPSWKT